MREEIRAAEAELSQLYNADAAPSLVHDLEHHLERLYNVDASPLAENLEDIEEKFQAALITEEDDDSFPFEDERQGGGRRQRCRQRCWDHPRPGRCQRRCLLNDGGGDYNDYNDNIGGDDDGKRQRCNAGCLLAGNPLTCIAKCLASAIGSFNFSLF